VDRSRRKTTTTQAKPASVTAICAAVLRASAGSTKYTSTRSGGLRKNYVAGYLSTPINERSYIMASYIGLIQFADQGIRNIKDTVKRGDTAIAEAEKMGMKIVQEFWTMGAYDAVVVFEAPDDETMSAFMLKIGSLGNVKSHTLRAFRRNEMENILAKIK
jgi:uncharacterized protein with GYD domain